MARNKRNDIDYFPHPVTHGKKMFYLRSKYKNDGYSVWFMLLEQLGKADYHFLNLKDEVELMYLSSEFMIDEKLLIEIIEVLVKFGEFDRKLWEENRILFNMKFIDNIKDAYKRRNNDCVNLNTLSEHLIDKGILKQSKSEHKQDKCNHKGSRSTQTKLKNTKLKETKEDFSQENTILEKLPTKGFEGYGFLGKVRCFMESEFEYVFDQNQVIATNAIGGKIKAKWMLKYPDKGKPTNQEKYLAFKSIIDNLDNFNKANNFDLIYINNNFERIYNSAKSNVHGKEKQIISKDTIQRVIEKREQARQAEKQ